ncbi:MAG TPA: MFS transporter [Candidatus Dormibacteraeota bacterium]|nr:MFS transporter [Candidatus Dormibacteraeota bacterium]
MSRKDFIFLTLFRATRSVAAGIIMIAFPYLVLERLKYGPLALGLIYVAGAAGTAVFGLLLGLLGDIWGRKRALFISGALLPLCGVLVFLSGRLGVLIVASAVGGLSATGSLAGGGIGGASAPIQSAVIADMSHRDKRTYYFSTFAFMSGAFGSLGVLMARLFDVHQAFLVATLVSLAGLPFVPLLSIVSTRGKLRELPSKVTIGKFSVTALLNGLAGGLVVPFLIPFFVLVYSLPESKMAVYGFAAGLLAAITILFAPMLERRLGFVRTVAWTRGIGSVLLVLMPLARWLPVSLVIYLLTPALRVVAVPVQQAALVDMVERDERGRALAANQVARLAAGSAGIVFTGWMFETAEIALPFFIYAGAMFTNIYFYFRFFSAWDAAGAARRAGQIKGA